ncbi:Concanavalin A-like lectin/glucanases superfamily protein [Calidithermus roseus]|uniref:Concanavalin A-like lectin/glucanases superfamily protein n=2 Tax=Thermales TaxID=68933 RepID=A0A399F4A9_9DEIN|nr:Concanavalin A-like lectin/glucanases superfamily protein [Calidithermus roseus]
MQHKNVILAMGLGFLLAGLMAGCSPAAPCTTAICLVAHWPLNEAPGATSVADVVANPIFNQGAPKPGPVAAWPSFSGPTQVSGQVGGALYFPGNGNTWVEVPSTPDLNLSYGSLYLEAGVAPVGCGALAFYPVLDKWDQATQNGYALYLEGVSSGVVRAAFRLGNQTFFSNSFSANFNPPSSGTWAKVAVKVDGTNGAFYVNGSPAGTFTAPSGVTNNTLPLWLGALHTQPSGLFCEVALDEIKIGTINPSYSGQ